MPDHRKARPHTRYAIREAALGAFGIFFTQSLAFLACQRQRQHPRGQNNAHPLLEVPQIPWDKQVRQRRDAITPSPRAAVFVAGFALLEQPCMWAPFRGLGSPLLVALEGTHSLSATARHGQNGLRRQLSTGPPLSSHAALTPGRVCPGQSQGLAWPPEDVMPQAGPVTPDGERAAGKRGRPPQAEPVAPHDVP